MLCLVFVYVFVSLLFFIICQFSFIVNITHSQILSIDAHMFPNHISVFSVLSEPEHT